MFLEDKFLFPTKLQPSHPFVKRLQRKYLAFNNF